MAARYYRVEIARKDAEGNPTVTAHSLIVNAADEVEAAEIARGILSHQHNTVGTPTLEAEDEEELRREKQQQASQED